MDEKDALAEKFAEESAEGETLRSTFDKRLSEWEVVKNKDPSARANRGSSGGGAKRKA